MDRLGVTLVYCKFVLASYEYITFSECTSKGFADGSRCFPSGELSSLLIVLLSFSSE
jgi:hypothetical protein